MADFTVRLSPEAIAARGKLREAAKASLANRKKNSKTKASRQEGLYKQIAKTISLLANPRHTSLHTHEYDSLQNPFDENGKVFEAYAQNATPGAYRVFWCYGPDKGEITIIAITPHP
ncbi:MAG: hypothetical protein WD845_04495 [Pirellulales bacterium]